MSILKKAIPFIIGLPIVISLVSFALPKEVAVSRTTVINATPDKVFPHVNDLKMFEKWSPWAQIDPNMKVTYSGADQGKGQKSSWTSENPNVGNGSQEITDSVANERIETKLDFGKQGIATAGFDFAPEGQGTKVTWRFKTDTGYNPMMRWMGLLFDRWIGGDYEKGLKSLKETVEKAAE